MKHQQTNANTLKVNEVFYSFQGEGKSVGTPSVFLRLSGCNYNCNFCDTDHQQYKEWEVKPLRKHLKELLETYNCNNLVITGGEPLLQYGGLKKLTNYMHCNIQMETNGSIINPVIKKIDYILSPKTNHELIFDFYHEFPNAYFKFLVMNQSDIDMVKRLQDKYNYSRTIWLQPLFEQAENITQLILDNHLKNIRISGQMHKYLNKK